MFKEVVYRTRQFAADINPSLLSDVAVREIKAQLSEKESRLYFRYSLSDQDHAYKVYKMLREAGHAHPHLLTAALLHDIGKSRYTITVWDRVWPVLVKKIFPSLYHQWGEAEATSWKRPFVIIKKHPDWGAEMATSVGSHPTVISLICRHQDKLNQIETEEDQLLSLLQWADDQN
ncbi:MAG: HD domain-containing protein [Chloroflexota bacterium]